MKEKFLLPWKIEESKIEVIPAALELSNYDLSVKGDRIKKKYGENLIVSIKSLWSQNVKGLAFVVEGMKYVKEKHPDWKYLVIGPGDPSPLKKIAKENGIEDVVLFPGPIPNNEKLEYWQATDIAPHSFVYEFSTAISFLEFLAMGRPNIITEVGAVREYVKEAAYIVKAEDPKAMGEGIIKLIEDKKLRDDLGKKARKLFEENYSIQSTVIKLENIYSGLRT
jgi:glycosyltransferase involved in cell wall biosynthesis